MNYRPIREDELAQAVEVHDIALADLTQRHGATFQAGDPAKTLEEFRYNWRTGIFWGVESDGRLVAIANAIMLRSISQPSPRTCASA